ncbi:MAG: hypothetical protein WAZ12_01540 [Candidatus Absconditicoccaceae bacterium]
MKVLIDQNNLLAIENPNIPKLKEYTNIASGYRFSDYDKGIIVYHKKEIKIINLKNLGDNMNIFYVNKRESLIENNLDLDGFLAAVVLFSGFDENTGNKYFFIPRMKEVELEPLNIKLEKLGIDIKLEKNEKGIVVKSGLDMYKKSTAAIFDNDANIGNILSFLFGLVLIYGKMDIKNGEIIGIKIHIPLFGQYIKYKESIDEIIKNLQNEGIFLNHSILQNGDGIVYQINSGDYELLGSFVNFYQSVEKVQKIFKQEFTEKAKSELINFIDINEQVPENGKEEVLRMIDDGVMKVLTVG